MRPGAADEEPAQGRTIGGHNRVSLEEYWQPIGTRAALDRCYGGAQCANVDAAFAVGQRNSLADGKEISNQLPREGQRYFAAGLFHHREPFPLIRLCSARGRALHRGSRRLRSRASVLRCQFVPVRRCYITQSRTFPAIGRSAHPEHGRIEPRHALTGRWLAASTVKKRGRKISPSQ